MNTIYFDNLNDSIAPVTTCAELTAVQTAIANQFAAMEANLAAEILAVTPLTAIPTDLTSVIHWITGQAGLYAAQLITLTTNLAFVTSQLARIQATIAAKATSLGCP